MVWKHRYSVLSALLCASMLCYVDRMVMASAVPFIAKDFNLSPIAVGWVLSAFFAGYTLMQIPGGILTDRFGPRVVLTGSIAWWSIVTTLTGGAVGVASLVVIRVIFGCGEGPFPAAAAKTLSTWFPSRELARANGLLQASTGVGAAVAPILAVMLLTQWGWRSVFYSLSLPGIVLTAVTWLYVRDSPSLSRHVTAQERAEYEPSVVREAPNKGRLYASLRTPGVLWCAVCLFLANTVAWGLMNWLPTYLLEARNFSAAKMGPFAALTNLAGAVGFYLGGYICDRYFGQKLRVPIMVGLLSSAGFLYLAAIATTGELAVACLVPAFVFSAAARTAIFTLPLFIVPKQAVGAAFGLVNMAGQLAGVLAAVSVGYVLDLTDGNFQVVLYCMVAITCLALYPASRTPRSVSV